MRAAVVALATLAAAQGPGDGISKATYATNNPSAGHAWLLEYLPVATATDECANDVCECEWQGETFGVQQGRVYLDVHHEEPFGLHLVNVSAHWTTGGLSVSEVEAIVTEKLGNLSRFDAWLDFHVGLYTTELDAFIAAFDAGGVAY